MGKGQTLIIMFLGLFLAIIFAIINTITLLHY